MSIFFSSFPPCLVTPNEPFQRVTSQPYHSRSSLWMSPKASWSLSLFSLRILTSSFTEMIFCTPVPDQIKGKKKHVTWHILYTINLLLLCSSLLFFLFLIPSHGHLSWVNNGLFFSFSCNLFGEWDLLSSLYFLGGPLGKVLIACWKFQLLPFTPLLIQAKSREA